MLKKTFYLFSLSLLFFGTTGCNSDKKCNMKVPLAWNNNRIAHFLTLKLSIAGNYYNIDTGDLKVSSDEPIEWFADVFEFPKNFNPPNVYVKNIKPQVTVTTRLADECLNNNERNDFQMRQTYLNMFSNILTTYPLNPGNNIDNLMHIDGRKGYITNCMWYWHSTRGDYKHTYTIDISSGPYKGDDDEDNYYNLMWKWVGDKNNLNKQTLNVDSHNKVSIKSMSVQGAAINVTPYKRFSDRLYMDGIMSERTFENVVVANTTNMSLTVR